MRTRVLDGLAYLTGARGPLRGAFDWLRAHGIGERVIKSALAAVLAYWLARFLPDNANPILAPMTAIFSINLTIAGGMRDAWQRVLGVTLGILFAVAVFELLGPGSIAIGIIIIASFYAGRRLGLESSGVQQLAVSTLLIVLGAVGAEVDNVALLHLANFLIGTGVGLVLNASVAPPNYVPDARDQLDALGHAIEGILTDLRDGLLAGMPHATALDCLYRARAAVATIHAVDVALDNAQESLAFNLMGTSQREVLTVYRAIGEALEHSALQTRIIARALTDATTTAGGATILPAWLEPDALGRPLANLLDEALAAMRDFLTPLDDPDVAQPVPVSIDGIARRREELVEAGEVHLPLLLPDGWMLVGEVAALATQLVTDLSAVQTEVVDPATGKRLRWWQATLDSFTWWRED
jgi:hypothetical protein